MKFYIVATPIGNLEDISFRALQILREVDFILAEDTRVTKRILDHYKINTQMVSYFQHSGIKKIDKIINLIKQGKNLALVTDAGTPGISDPGNKLVSEIVEAQNFMPIQIIPVPGPSALVAALSISGFPTDKFIFMGFPPHKKGRRKFLQKILENKKTVVFYESCHRIVKCLEQLNKICIDTEFCLETKHFAVCRELTKKFESVYRGNIKEVLEQVKNDPIKGEYVIVVGNYIN